MKLVTAAEMRDLEQAAVAAGVSEAQLMEEAGLAVAQEAWMLLGTLEGRRIIVLAGPGNNGGDGLVAARHLVDWGADVLTYIPRKRRDETLLAPLVEREATIVAGEDDPDGALLDSMLAGAELVIDALLGIGQKRPIEPTEAIGVALLRLAEACKGFRPPKVLAVDLPTGTDADTGATDPLTVPAELTVTFGLPKVGMYQAPASGIIGRVQVIDIGIPKEAQAAVKLELMTARWARETLPARPDDANKGTFGKVLVIGGSRRYVGAPRLAAEGAYRAGAGLVTIACPEPLVGMISGALPEAIYLPLDATSAGTVAAGAAAALIAELEGYRSAVFGPGLTNTEPTQTLVHALLDALGATGGAVIDADALNALAAKESRPAIPANAVLTPHPGEMARLLGVTVADVQAKRLETARAAAAKFGCTVVLKGAHTVVAAADGRTALSPYANPLLATAGSGDVLGGMIGGYIAQGLAPFEAACLGVYMHAATGESLREEYGDAGLLAHELASRLPRTVKEIRAG
jgi:NAD(P)H-hydrate epimerase